ncbi:hypothetical protein [Pseudomonas fluorescens]|uniref:hypothetical protein n=1 Tax=Pseudomonas fluorescens TaxID=294 RepID=UPI001912EDD9|nr:hypothetical protein [Pseudomonas fluorescens]
MTAIVTPSNRGGNRPRDFAFIIIDNPLAFLLVRVRHAHIHKYEWRFIISSHNATVQENSWFFFNLSNALILGINRQIKPRKLCSTKKPGEQTY